MPKFLTSHTLPAGAMNRGHIDALAQAAQESPKVEPYRSFINVEQGRAICVMEAPDPLTLSAWFSRMRVPCDSITPLELESECGTIRRM
jgi:hypothetical protein